MERSLDLDLLAAALGERAGLPSAEELQELMGEVEVQLFLRKPRVSDKLLETAWYLHAVASVAEARERYTLARQRQAFLVSAHIFDLALATNEFTRAERLVVAFGASIGYRRGGREPNATAIMRRVRGDIHTDMSLRDHIVTLSLEAGVAFLGFETRTLFRWLSVWRRQLNDLAGDSQLQDLKSTIFGPTHMLILGVEDLLTFLVHGTSSRLERGLERLRQTAVNESGPDDLNARWVAAHLLTFGREASKGSIWNDTILPPHIPRIARQAFAVANPPVLTFWEPQRELLRGDTSPFDPLVRRTILAVPTSGGKSLFAQVLAVEHLVRSNSSVCYVAPTRSLGREVRTAMAGRIRVLNKEVRAEQNDFPSASEIFAGAEYPSNVEVMTPERLLHMIRHDAAGVLAEFGLFIFDEAQLMKEKGRGFTIESLISLLDHFTRDSSHKIVLISAAMGNAGGIAQWLGRAGVPLLHESQWRGPRRLHAVFTTKADWSSTTAEKVRGTKWPYRLSTSLSGLVRLRLAQGHTKSLVTAGDTGWRLVRKSATPDLIQSALQKDTDKSTKNARIAAEMILGLGHAGSVLVVASTRNQAQGLALELAEVLGRPAEPDIRIAPLLEFVEQQLGDRHPLTLVLRSGVAFHHAGLPLEVLEALEGAVREDLLNYLVCTSTLTDGVNLPVRTVVIYDQPYKDQPEDALIRGARLVNAVGRAGRSGRETEGWIVLVRGASPSDSDFEDLAPADSELEVNSTLASDEAIAELVTYDDRLRLSHDAIFDPNAPKVASDFVSFIWLMLAIEESFGNDPRFVDVDGVVESTLASSQSANAHLVASSVAEQVRAIYASTDVPVRLRWSRAGTSVCSARRLDEMALAIALQINADATEADYYDDPVHALENIDLHVLLNLPEAPQLRFRLSPRGADLPVDLPSLLQGWISGLSYTALAAEFLSDVKDESWKIEQMVDVATRHFEHYLAWMLGAISEHVNIHLEELGDERRFCPTLGQYVRYGVQDSVSLVLMLAGIRSRRLANSVSTSVPADVSNRDQLVDWLNAMSISEWRSRFSTSATDILDLLEFSRPRRRSLLRSLLESGEVSISVTDELPTAEGEVSFFEIRPIAGEPIPASLALYSGNELVSRLYSRDQSDISAILDTGLDLRVVMKDAEDRHVVSIRLVS